MKKDDFLRLEN